MTDNLNNAIHYILLNPVFLSKTKAKNVYDKFNLTPSECKVLQSKIKNISDNQNKNLANQPKILQSYFQYIKDLSQFDLLTLSEEKILTQKIYAANGEEKEALLNELVEHNLRLVLSIASSYSRGVHGSMDSLDLIQEGNLGLMKAAKKFNPNLGYKFSTYATWWIKQGIGRSLSDKSRTIRVPVHMVESINKMKRSIKKLEQESSIEPTDDMIAKDMGVTVKEVKKIKHFNQQPISLDIPISEDGKITLKDYVNNDIDISANNVINTEEKTSLDELHDALLRSLNTLDSREEEILKLRYGLNEQHKTYTLIEVSKLFGLTKERIRQIENQALKKLQHPARNAELKDFQEYM